MTEQRITGIAYNGTEYVPKPDYDALAARLAEAEQTIRGSMSRLAAENVRLAARLAEAERLLRLWFEYREPDDRLTAYSAKVEAFLRAADSATESPSDCG